ncbi:MAG: hydrogenase subunit MbhD domain-containing protein [Bacillota bacterium]
MTLAIILLYGMALAAALGAVLASQRLTAVVLLSVLSITLALLYSVFHAPDVAITEAVIGAGVVTAVYLITIARTGGDTG